MKSVTAVCAYTGAVMLDFRVISDGSRVVKPDNIAERFRELSFDHVFGIVPTLSPTGSRKLATNVPGNLLPTFRSINYSKE
jgi:hypothetical protein